MSSEALATFKPPLQVGGLPDGWRRVRLGEVFTERKEKGRAGLPVASVSIEHGLVLRSSLDRRVTSELPPEGHALVRKGDIAYNMMRMWQGACGLAEADCIVSPAYVVMTPSADVDPLFAHCALRSEPMISLLHGYSQGIVDDRLRLYPNAFAQVPINLPPLDEQRRIAEVVWSVDEAMAAAQDALASCRQLVCKLARHLSESCEATTTIASFGKIVTGRTPSPKQDALWGGDLPFVTPGDLVAGNISVSGATRTLVADSHHGATVLPANSVLVTCIGSTVGKSAIARERCATNQQINAICCPPEIAGFAYLASAAAYDTIVANAGKQAVPIINKSTFSAIEVPALSQAEMIEVGAMVDAIDGEIVAAHTSLETLHRTKATLMSDLLTGRVRVPA